MKDALAFLQALQTDTRAKELIKTMKIPENREKAADCYVSLASELGYTVTKEEIVAAAQEFSKLKQKKTDQVIEKISLSDNDLDNVAGGKQDPGHPGCSSTWTDNEWCWISDSCDFAINYYSGDIQPSQEKRDPGDNLDTWEMEFDPDEILNGEHCFNTIG